NAVFLRGVGGDAATERHKTGCSGYPEEEFSGTDLRRQHGPKRCSSLRDPQLPRLAISEKSHSLHFFLLRSVTIAAPETPFCYPITPLSATFGKRLPKLLFHHPACAELASRQSELTKAMTVSITPQH